MKVMSHIGEKAFIFFNFVIHLSNSFMIQFMNVNTSPGNIALFHLMEVAEFIWDSWFPQKSMLRVLFHSL